jgi:hypothetical protein
MIKDQNFQTTHSNNNIIEQVNEQELNEEKLQDITGGCIGCGVLSAVTLHDGAYSFAKGRVFGDAKEIRRGAAQLAISADSLNSASRQIRPCANCITNAVLYAATKAM